MAASSTRASPRRALAALVVGALAPLAGAQAAWLEASVRDESGEPVQDAVAYALPLDADGNPLPPAEPVEIDQVDKEFVPYVTAVQVGTRVDFPNRDGIRHHVYSFSEAKTFEIPLYRGTPSDPIDFDTAGEVALGCNIHDWMKAYVFVSESPWFAVTDAEGNATFELPAGDYRVEVWHPELAGEAADTAQRREVAEASPARLEFRIERKRVWTPRRAPALGDSRYR